MAADIPIGQGAENGVRHCVQGYIRVRMADQGLMVRNNDSQQRNMITGTEPVHIISAADPERRALAALCHDRLHPHQIVRCRHLDIILIADNQRNTMTSSFHDRCIVCQRLPGNAAVRRQQGIEAETLRCLRPPKTFPGNRIGYQSRRISTLQRVDDLQGRDHAV